MKMVIFGLPIMVRMIIHSKRIQRDSHTAALLIKFVPDKMNKLEGNSALSASVITALFRGILIAFWTVARYVNLLGMF